MWELSRVGVIQVTAWDCLRLSFTVLVGEDFVFCGVRVPAGR